MKITVNKDNVKIEEFDVVHEGEHRVNKCSFSFSEEYTEELVKKAIFTSQNSSVEVAIINNECNIPTEILKARNIVLLGVYAYKVVDDKLDLRYSPSPDAFKVNSGSYIEGANESEEITPSQFEQYMQAMNDGLNKVEESIKKMDEATSSATQLVDNINQKLENGDFIGPEGPQGIQGGPGTNGKDGVGITTITSGQPTVEEDKTITPITVNKTDGSSQIFKVEAKNGLDGQNGINGQDGKDGKDGVNGQDGLTPTIGDNGNWFIGDTDTGKPSRGEVGPSPDLTDYVKNTDYATATKAGIIKATNYLNVTSDGVAYASPITQEIYESTNPNVFIAKGTLENIKDDYVESSTPVKNLTATVTNVQNDQDEGMPKQTASGEIVSVDDAIAYKTFNVTVDGASEQETTTGKNNLNNTLISQTLNGLNIQINEDKSVKIQGTANKNTNIVLNRKPEINTGTYTLYGCKTFIESEEANGWWNAENEPIAKTFTTKPTLSSQGFFIYIENGQTVNKTYYPMLLKGTYTNENIGDYEPYTGGQPSPNPDYPQEIATLTFDKITRRGKNYLNIEDGSQTINGVTVTKNNGKITVNGTATNTCFFPISKPIDNFRPGKYVLSTNNSKTLNNNQNLLRIMKEDNTGYLDSTITNFSKINNTTIFNITSDDDVNNAYLLLRIDTGTVLDNFVFYPQLEQGPQATDGEPYQGQTYDIDLQGNEMVELPNGVKDELVIDKYGNVSLIKNVGKVVFDGSEDEYWANTYGTNLFDLQDYFNSQNQFVQQAIALSNYYIYNSVQSSINENLENGEFALQKIKIPMGIVYNVFFKNNSCSTVDEWKAWLQEHNTTIYYQLEEPQTILLGKLTDIITTLNGTNNISINGNLPTTISTTYALDIKKYIDNKLAEISSAVIEEG